MNQSTWDISKAPSQKGKTIIVTGANAGLGFETTLALEEFVCIMGFADVDFAVIDIACVYAKALLFDPKELRLFSNGWAKEKLHLMSLVCFL